MAISSRFKKFVVYFVVLIFGISLLTFVGSVYRTNSVSINPNQIVIPVGTLDYDLVLRYAKLFYPEFEFITRNSPRKYSMDDFMNSILDSIQISENFKNPISEDMTKNWNETFGEKLSQKDFAVVACFWSNFWMCQFGMIGRQNSQLKFLQKTFCQCGFGIRLVEKQTVTNGMRFHI